MHNFNIRAICLCSYRDLSRKLKEHGFDQIGTQFPQHDICNSPNIDKLEAGFALCATLQNNMTPE